MQCAAKAADLKRHGAIQPGVIAAVIRRDHGDTGAELGSSDGDLAGIGADTAGSGSELAGEQENVHGGYLRMPMPPRPCRVHSEFPDDSETRAPAACPG